MVERLKQHKMIQNPQVYWPAGSVGLAFFDNKKPCYLKKYT